MKDYQTTVEYFGHLLGDQMYREHTDKVRVPQTDLRQKAIVEVLSYLYDRPAPRVIEKDLQRLKKVQFKKRLDEENEQSDS